MAQPLVLAIEPDLRQAAIVKRIVREQALADVTVVDSRDAAIEALRTCMPDVLLLSALMSPRDEDELIAHLRTLDNAGHLQTHTIPQLASTLGPGEERASRGLLSAFRRKKDAAPVVAGCDPDLFAEEIRVYLQRAADKKRQRQDTDFTAPDMRRSASVSTRAAVEPSEEPAAAPSSSWSSPFEWKPAGSSRHTTAPAPAHAAPPTAPEEASAPEPVVAAMPAEAAPAAVVEAPVPESPVASPVAAATPEPIVEAPVPESPAASPVAAATPEPVVEAPVPVAPRIVEPIAAAAVTREEPVAAAAPPMVKSPAPEPVRLKPVADRAAKTAAKGPLYALVKGEASRERDRRDRLGPLARWAHSEAPRAAKSSPVTSDDVRALISSLAVPAAVASVTYPDGCRIRRVRVPLSPEAAGGEGAGNAILSRRTPAEQRSKQPSA